MKISVSSYSFDQYIKNGKFTQLDTVKEAKNLGFSAIEFTDITPYPDSSESDRLDYARKIRECADNLGITVNAYTVNACLYFESEEKRLKEVERLKHHLDVALILGAKVFRHDACRQLSKRGQGRSFDMMLPYLAQSARLLAVYGENMGIVTSTENHGFTAQDSSRMERLFNAVAHDNYGLLVDIGNFLCVGENPVRAVSLLAPYAVHVHVKDFKVYGEQNQDTAFMSREGSYLCPTVIGEGDVDVERCLRILKNAGYDDYISIEYEGREDCISGIMRGYENLRKILLE